MRYDIPMDEIESKWRSFKEMEKRNATEFEENIMESMIRSGRPEVFCKKGVLRNFTIFTGKHLCQSLVFNKESLKSLFIKKEPLAQVFSCEFCEISKNNFLHRTPLVAASR